MPSIDIIFINLQAIKETFLISRYYDPLSALYKNQFININMASQKITLSIVTDCSIKEPLAKETNWLGLKNWLC